jgi:hypothetical protein
MKNMHFGRRTLGERHLVKTNGLSSLGKSKLIPKISYVLILINISRDFPEGD